MPENFIDEFLPSLSEARMLALHDALGNKFVGNWDLGSSAYKLGNIVLSRSILYSCIQGHDIGFDDEPGVGNNWETYWQAMTSEPFTPGIINPQTGLSYALSIADHGTIVTMDNAAVNTASFATFGWQDPLEVEIIQIGAGVTTLSVGNFVTLNGVDGGSCDIAARYGKAKMTCVAEAKFVVTGDIGPVV